MVSVSCSALLALPVAEEGGMRVSAGAERRFGLKAWRLHLCGRACEAASSGPHRCAAHMRCRVASSLAAPLQCANAVHICIGRSLPLILQVTESVPFH